MNIQIEEKDGFLEVKSPYNPFFVERARNLNGKWNHTTYTWKFDSRDQERVLNLLKEIYGYGETEFTNVKVHLDEICDSNVGEVILFGRCLVRRRHKRERVLLGQGVTVQAGGFPPKGGSYAHPRLYWEEGTVLFVRDVPLSLLKKELETHGEDAIKVSE